MIIIIWIVEAKNVEEMKLNTRIKLNEFFLIYRIFKRNALFCVRPVDFSFFVWWTSGAKQFHNRSVSSAAALIIVLPSGDMAICKTRAVCPVNSHCFTIDGYFQIVNWLFAYPWADMSSLYVFDHSKEHTCDLESTESRSWPLLTFQNLIQRSAVPSDLKRGANKIYKSVTVIHSLLHFNLPPPVAIILGFHGHHAKARTAAWCWLNVWSGCCATSVDVFPLEFRPDQILTKLSLPTSKRIRNFNQFLIVLIHEIRCVQCTLYIPPDAK